ncbi:gastrula zinc finger protein xLCGF3.1 isoform X1 [Cryptotermes secundus]|uniref:gastrula zinc finger protein xLCGF3.1 isoform X1 n=1 Tax=Cryptotermes secundus TaxID=105785 RepID=UPI001454BB8A|nr:gastrula zinc finger protein xLCGF3.1 isoform X1 [Cryptotermes secundus]
MLSDVVKYVRKREMPSCPEKGGVCTKAVQESNFICRSEEGGGASYETSEDLARCNKKASLAVNSYLYSPSDQESNSEQKLHFPMRPENGSHQCDVCAKVFLTTAGIRRHKKTHIQDRPYACGMCTKTYKNSSQLGVHKKRVHFGNNSHICTVCGYAATYKGILREHLKRHFGEFNFHCELCGKGCYSNMELQRHSNLHTGERPFGCNVCGKKFISKCYLMRHKEDTHPGIQKDGSTIAFMGYSCEICGKVYKVKKSLQLHSGGHTGKNRLYLCDICGKVLTSNVLLEAHKRIHTGEKPFGCNICGKHFAVKQGLRFHLRTHTGEKPYTCDHCGKSFTQQSSLVVHKRYHTGQRPFSCQLCSKGFVTRTLLKIHQKSKCI